MAITPTVHIGKEIEARLNYLKISASEFARKLNTSKQNVNRILKKESFETSTLQKYCEILDFNFFTLFCPAIVEKYEAHGKHGFVAKNIEYVDNRDMLNVSDEKEFTKINEVSEEIVLPLDCPEEAVHTVEKLTLKVNMLQQLLAEKNERIEEYKERIKELKGE